VTGHEGCGKTRAGVDWARLATAVDTLVVLMGVAALPRIAQELIAHGARRRRRRARALGHDGLADGAHRRLDDIGGRARAAALEPPVVIVIGEVVGLADGSRGSGPNAPWSTRWPEPDVKRPFPLE